MRHADRHREVVQFHQRLRVHCARLTGGKDVFVHISAVERAGLKGLNDNQKIAFELQSGRDGKESAGDLRLL